LMTYADSGSVYEGDWLRDKCHGFGFLTEKNRDTYRGFWDSDMRDGEGVLTAVSGEKQTFDGKWSKDRQLPVQISLGNMSGAARKIDSKGVCEEDVYVAQKLHCRCANHTYTSPRPTFQQVRRRAEYLWQKRGVWPYVFCQWRSVRGRMGV
jgi:hypothetical protein